MWEIALVTLQFLHYQLYQETIKLFVYSVKLKLEFNILSKLVDLVNPESNDRETTLEFLEPTFTQEGSGADPYRTKLPSTTKKVTENSGYAEHVETSQSSSMLKSRGQD